MAKTGLLNFLAGDRDSLGVWTIAKTPSQPALQKKQQKREGDRENVFSPIFLEFNNFWGSIGVLLAIAWRLFCTGSEVQ